MWLCKACYMCQAATGLRESGSAQPRPDARATAYLLACDRWNAAWLRGTRPPSWCCREAKKEECSRTTLRPRDVQARAEELEGQLAVAQADKATAERRLKDLTMQAASMEAAYDALMREHAQLQRQAGGGAGSKKAD